MPALHCFPTLVWSLMAKDPLAINEELDTLIQEMRRKEDQQGGRVLRSNQGGWHSEFLDFDKAPLFKGAILDAIQEISTEISISKSSQATMNGCWININPKGASNKTHTHSDSMLSGAYYLRVPPNSGRIVLLDPRPQTSCLLLPIDKPTPLTSVSYYRQPQVGEFVIFPSWLPHYVEPNESDEERISIAFNMFFQRQ